LSPLALTYLIVSAVGGGLALFLVGLYRPAAEHAVTRKKPPWWTRLCFTPEQVGGFSYRQLFIISVAGLFLELLVIRWISSEIRIFAYLKNFVLIACYLGFGLGCYLCRRRVNLLAMLLPLVFLALFVKLNCAPLRDLHDRLPQFLGETSEVHVWGVPSLPLSPKSFLRLGAAIVFIVYLFTLLSVAFVPVGQLVGWMLEQAPNGIRGYTINILGSLVGILFYTLLCFWSQPPAVWFAVGGLLMIIVLWRGPALRWGCLVCFGLAVAMHAKPLPDSIREYWSPYQKLMLFEYRPDGPEAELFSYNLLTNNTWYQQIIDLSPGFIEKHPEVFGDEPARFNAYNLPFVFYPNPPSVLVLGAGMGNDVAGALRGGARRVVAVEIDPLILDLGEQYHFERPYDDPRVQSVVNDARSYLQNGSERFDLIVFSLLDSHTNASHYTNIRIDNYVYTIEALRAARRLLKPDGVFIIKFQAEKPWIAGRLLGLMNEVFGRDPVKLIGAGAISTIGYFFIDGSRERIDTALSEPEVRRFVDEHGNFPIEPARLTTDDWPYFYQRAPGLPTSVLLISVVLVALSMGGLRWIGAGVGSIRWHFFFLGAGFLLLQVQVISKMALLFGTTWLVNAFVIGALLLLMIGANMIVERRPRFPYGAAYAGLFVTIAAIYLIPVRFFFLETFWLRAVVSTLVLCLPIFFAGIIFIKSFARAGFSGQALGANLIGALVGGLLESLSLWTGMRALLIVAGLLYLCSCLALGMETKSARGEHEAPERPSA